jgi:hypothetical protein
MVPEYRSDDPSSKKNSIYAIDNPAMKIAAMHHSHESFERSELVMKLKEI